MPSSSKVVDRQYLLRVPNSQHCVLRMLSDNKRRRQAGTALSIISQPIPSPLLVVSIHPSHTAPSSNYENIYCMFRAKLEFNRNCPNTDLNMGNEGVRGRCLGKGQHTRTHSCWLLPQQSPTKETVKCPHCFQWIPKVTFISSPCANHTEPLSVHILYALILERDFSGLKLEL